MLEELLLSILRLLGSSNFNSASSLVFETLSFGTAGFFFFGLWIIELWIIELCETDLDWKSLLLWISAMELWT